MTCLLTVSGQYNQIDKNTSCVVLTVPQSRSQCPFCQCCLSGSHGGLKASAKVTARRPEHSLQHGPGLHCSATHPENDKPGRPFVWVARLLWPNPLRRQSLGAGRCQNMRWKGGCEWNRVPSELARLSPGNGFPPVIFQIRSPQCCVTGKHGCLLVS